MSLSVDKRPLNRLAWLAAFVLAIILLSPISWFVIFKGQAYVHTFTNYLAWHMPFTLFGFAFCGYVLQTMLAVLRGPLPAAS